jgi:hypothetical protein
MNITISVPDGQQTAEITAGPGGGESVIEMSGGQQQAPPAPARRREHQADLEIEIEAGS